MSREQVLAEIERRGLTVPVDNESAVLAEIRRRGLKIPEEEGFLSRTARAFTESRPVTEFRESQQARGAQLANVFTGEGAAEQTLPETLLQVAGTEIGALGDVAGQAISETARAGFAALPTEAQQGLKSLGKGFLESSVGKAGIQALQSGAEAFAEFEKNNPRAARNISAVVNIASIFPAAVGAKAVGSAVAPGLKLAGAGIAKGAEAVGAAIPAVTKGIERGVEAAKDLPSTVKRGLTQAGEVKTRLVKGLDADKLLANRISATDATQALQELKSGQISVLADVAGDEIQGFTRAIGKVSGGARNIVSDALEGRSQGAVDRITDSLSKDISNVDAYFGNLDDIAKARSSVARPLYRKSYDQGKQLKINKRLNTLLKDPRIISAMDESRATLGVRLEARRNSVESIDGAKKILDDRIRVARRQGANELAKSTTVLKNDLVAQADRQVPSYKKARKVFSDFSSLEDAQTLGLDFTKQTPEQLKRMLKTMGNSEKEAFKIGVRENLQRVVSKTADEADPAKRVFGNQFKRNQIKAVFGEGKQINEFTRKMTEEIRAAKTKFRVLGGSRTDINIADDGEFIDAASQAARQGILRTTIEKAVESVAGAAKRKWTGLNNQNATKLAKILTNREAGIEALEKLIKNASKEQKLILQDAAKDLSR